MNIKFMKHRGFAIVFTAILMSLFAVKAEAAIDGVSGTDFDLTVSADFISTADGGSVHFWGYGISGGSAQYPGPTLIVNQGDTVTVQLKSELTVEGSAAPNVSIVFPGHEVTATGGVAGIITQEAPPDGSTVVTYTFSGTHPGAYTYSGGAY